MIRGVDKAEAMKKKNNNNKKRRETSTGKAQIWTIQKIGFIPKKPLEKLHALIKKYKLDSRIKLFIIMRIVIQLLELALIVVMYIIYYAKCFRLIPKEAETNRSKIFDRDRTFSDFDPERIAIQRSHSIGMD